MLPSPFFHDDSAAVRFWVQATDGSQVGASIARRTLHFRFHADIAGTDAVETYLLHRTEIDDAVRRRIATGSIEPVMLRESDLPR
jgi:hypothetical protein